MNRRSALAFTLMELLVVVVIIMLLTSVLLSALGSAKERGRRAVCQANVHQFLLAAQCYTQDNNHKLPTGQSEMGDDEHTPVITRQTRDDLLHYTEVQRLFVCPSLRQPFTEPDGWYYRRYGYVIGYNYLGGHGGTPWPLTGLANNHWKSPQSTTEHSWQPVVTDLNAWSLGEEKTYAPHGKRGAILEAADSGNTSAEGIPSMQIGAEGGNIGLLDGSVFWRPIDQMSIYRGSRQHENRGCFTAW